MCTCHFKTDGIRQAPCTCPISAALGLTLFTPHFGQKFPRLVPVFRHLGSNTRMQFESLASTLPTYSLWLNPGAYASVSTLPISSDPDNILPRNAGFTGARDVVCFPWLMLTSALFSRNSRRLDKVAGDKVPELVALGPTVRVLHGVRGCSGSNTSQQMSRHLPSPGGTRIQPTHRSVVATHQFQPFLGYPSPTCQN
eukprot:COSAG02_NODE_3552_length_6575_cov_3.200432_3_plen_197_part_00